MRCSLVVKDRDAVARLANGFQFPANQLSLAMPLAIHRKYNDTVFTPHSKALIAGIVVHLTEGLSIVAT